MFRLDENLETRIVYLIFIVMATFLIVGGFLILTNNWVGDLLLSIISYVRGYPAESYILEMVHNLGAEFVFKGCLLLALLCGWVTIKRLNIKLLNDNKNKWILFTAIAATFLLWILIFIGRNSIIDGIRYWWLGDDAMISMRYARNLASGNGLVWNPGERVEGYSNFLWTLYMSLVHLLPIPLSKISLVILVTNFFLSIITLPILQKIVKLLGGNYIVSALVLGSFVLGKDGLAWASDGFETALLTFLTSLAVYQIIKDSKSNKPHFFTYFLIAVISIVRADAFIISGLLYFLSLFLSENKKIVIAYSSISLIIPIIFLMWRIAFYGDILPNTAYLKTMYWNSKYLSGISYVLKFVRQYAIIIFVVLIGWFLSKDRIYRLLVLLVLFYSFYIFYVGGDAFKYNRFFVPVIPILMILSMIVIQRLNLRMAPTLLVCTIGLISIPLIIPGYSAPSYANVFSVAEADVGNIRIGLLIKNNTREESKIAGFWAGSSFYFSERYGIDMLGKSDKYIAHLPVTLEEAKVGHNKFDFDHSIGKLKPDLVISNFNLPVSDDEMGWASKGDWAFIGQLYFNKNFKEHCFPYPVKIETWHTVFVCDWSLELNYRDKWKELTVEK
jgi:hypothetical protein